jgi:hypothetical protein
VDLHLVFGLVALASLFGVDGFAIGCVVGFGVRWRGVENKTAWIVTGAVVALVLVLGIWQTTAIQTVPSSTSDARAQDYSLSRLWQMLALWVTCVNALGAAAGVRFVLRRGRRGGESKTEPLPSN